MNREQQPIRHPERGEHAVHQPAADPSPQPARPDPPATLRERLPAELAARVTAPAGERSQSLRAGTTGELGREHIKRVIARLGDGRQARAELEPEAGS